ncbi:MAG: hypothetical protein ACI9LA_002005, partial [Bacteroidia bacterium]
MHKTYAQNVCRMRLIFTVAVVLLGLLLSQGAQAQTISGTV